MAKQIVAWCDVCMTKDEQVPATGVRVAFDGGNPVEVDLCETCVKEIVEPLRKLVAEVGQPIKTTEARELNCPTCGKSYKNEGSLQKHMRTIHRTKLSDPSTVIEESAKAYECPDCSKRFDTPQGLGAHRNKSHGYVAAHRVRAQEEELTLDAEESATPEPRRSRKQAAAV